MQHMSKFEVRGSTKLEALVAELTRRAELMSADIEEEEAQTGISDVYNPSYSMLARALRGRRGNLLESVATLEYQLKSADTVSRAA